MSKQYSVQTTESLPHYLSDHAPAAMKVVEATSAADLECVEMGDGNINLVFVVTNKLNAKKIIVKQVRLCVLLCFECS